MSSTPDSLAQRYGTSSRTRRTAVVAGSVVVAVSFLGWLLWAMLFHANPAVSSEEIGHEVVDDHTATWAARFITGHHTSPGPALFTTSTTRASLTLNGITVATTDPVQVARVYRTR